MRVAKSWVGMVVAVGVAGVYAGCGGEHASSVGDMDTAAGGVGDLPGAGAGSKAMAGGGSSAQPTASCDDGDKNGGESDTDCGGAECASCPAGSSCTKHRDCDNGVCLAGSCRSPTCTDGVVNGDESDIDCGGVGLRGAPGSAGEAALLALGSACPRCDTGQICRVAADCSSIHCANRRCAAGTCYDAIQNGDESDVDCGGPSCAPCLDTQYCDTASDCASSRCDGGRCIRPE